MSGVHKAGFQQNNTGQAAHMARRPARRLDRGGGGRARAHLVRRGQARCGRGPTNRWGVRRADRRGVI